MDLCSINQTSSGFLGANCYSCPFMRLVRDTGGSGPVESWNWVPIKGRNHEDGLDVYMWHTIEGKAVGTPNTAAIKRAMIGDIDIGLVLQGARKYTTSVWVQLVQFNDEMYTPPLITTPDNSTAVYSETQTPFDDIDDAKHDEFWKSQVDYMIANPLNKKNYSTNINPWKILYSKRFEFNPTSTDESNADAHEHVFKLKYSMDKIIDYSNAEYATLGDDVENDEITAPNQVQATTTEETLYPTCAKKGRVYLLIKATAPEKGSVAGTELSEANSIDNYASFDLRVTRSLFKLRAENMG